MTTLSINTSNGFKPHFIKKRVTEQLSYTSKKQQRKKKKGEKEQSQHRKSVCPKPQIFLLNHTCLANKILFPKFLSCLLVEIKHGFSKATF